MQTATQEFISGHWLHEFDLEPKAYPIVKITGPQYTESYVTESTLRLMMKHQEVLLKVNPEECKLYFDADDKFITEYEDGDKEIAIPIRTPENIKLWPMTFIGSGWMWYESNEQGEEV